MVDNIGSEFLEYTKRLVLKVDERFPIDAAFWAKDVSKGLWRLFIAPSRIITHGPMPVYQAFSALLREHAESAGLSLSDISVVEPTGNEVRDVRRRHYLTRNGNVSLVGTLDDIGLRYGLLWTYRDALKPTASIRLRNADNSDSDYTLYFYNYTMGLATAKTEGDGPNSYSGAATFGVYFLHRLISASGVEPPWNLIGLAPDDPNRLSVQLSIMRFPDYVRLFWGAADYAKEGFVSIRDFKRVAESAVNADFRRFGDF